MASHKAAFDAGEVERLVILVVVIIGAEVFIPVAGHILLEESYKVFEEFEAVLSQFIAELATGDDDPTSFPDAEKLFSHTKSKMHTINNWYSVFYKISPKYKSVFGGQAGDYIFAKKPIKSAKTHLF